MTVGLPDLLDEPEDSRVIDTPTDDAAGRSWRRVLTTAVDVVAMFLLWAVVVVPDNLDRLSALTFLRLPIEGVVIIGLALVVPRRWRTPGAVLAGLLLAVLTIVKLADIGFYAVFDRPSNPASDWVYLGSTIDLLSVSFGRSAAITSVIVGGLLVVGLLLGWPWAVLRVVHVIGWHRRASTGALVLVGVGWVMLAAIGLGPVSSMPVASAESTRVLVGHVIRFGEGVGDQRTFEKAAAADPLQQIPDDQLLDGLRGKDVIVAFVESYGRVAIEGSGIAIGVTAVLNDGTRRLSDVGFSSRSAFLTSPTFGGLSWLAHATLQSGLWINSQQRYDQLFATSRETLSEAFQRAGWRTVNVAPSNGESWTEGERFYRFDAVYHAYNVGYRGPRFGYATMPDQYVLDALRRLELAPSNRPNVMAEIDLVSSHTPWTPLPRMVPWSELGDGSVFDPMPGEGPTRDVVWRESRAVQASYGDSIEYTLSALISFVEIFGDPNLVLIMLGDHQPATIVSGAGAGHDVPVTIVAHDPAVLTRLDKWAWQPGMLPGPDAPVTAMDAFRDLLIAAFSEGSLGAPVS